MIKRMKRLFAMAFLFGHLTSRIQIALFCALLQMILPPAVQAVQLVVREIAPIKIELPALKSMANCPTAGWRAAPEILPLRGCLLRPIVIRMVFSATGLSPQH